MISQCKCEASVARITRFFLGDFVAALLGSAMARVISSSPGYETLSAQESHTAILAWLALILTYLGYINQGRALMNEAIGGPPVGHATH
jgi:hypothetical protein